MTRPTRLNRTTSARALAACALLVALTLASTPPAHAERSAAASPARSAASTPALRQAQPAGSPVGHLDSLSRRFPATLPDRDPTQMLFGWAADPDAPQEPLEIHIYADGQPYGAVSGGPRLGPHPRPDVQAAHPWVGASPGFQLGLLTSWDRASDLVRPRTFCAYAINVGPGANTTLGCVVAPNPALDGYEPIGAVDSIRVSPGMLTITGWAGDPDSGGEASPIAFSARSATRPFGTGSTFWANQARPDVAVAYPRLPGTVGFSQGLALPPGLHYVCLTIGNLGRQGLHHMSLGCAFVLIPDAPPPGPHDPIGHVDRVRVWTTTWGHTVEVEGWAADPDTPGAVTVHVYSAGGGAAAATTQRPRPDVQAAFPWAGPNTGFTSGARNAPVCLFALQAGEGAGTERFLGCYEAN